MRPGQIHIVFTSEPSICHGGYFLSMATLRQSFAAVAHTFFERNVATNSECRTFGIRMNAMIALNYRYHVLGDQRESGE